MPPSLAHRLARRACSIRYRSLPAPVRDKAHLYLLDWAGCAISGARSLDLSFLAGRGPPEASLAGAGRRSSALSAALVNGTAAHLLELDDVHEPSIYHPGAPVIAAALAAAQREHASGRALLEGIVAGYEVSIALGCAVQPAHYRFWHTTGTMGTLGAAAAAGRVMGLDERGTERALHVAATQAAGLWATIGGGTPAKALHAGKAAHAGLLAALWVREGLGASPALDVPRGYIEATAGRAGRVDLGKFHILDVAFKLHASCRFTHAAVDGALALRKENPEPRSVRVRVARSALQLVGRAPTSAEAARFSLAWCVACAFARGRVSPEEFTPPALRDRRIRRVLGRIHLIPDGRLERLYPRFWPAVVEVEGPGGPRRVRVDRARGDPENPLSREELVGKFAGLTGRSDRAAAIESIDRVRDVARFQF